MFIYYVFFFYNIISGCKFWYLVWYYFGSVVLVDGYIGSLLMIKLWFYLWVEFWILM